MSTFFSFSPTDVKIVTGSDDATARIWDFARCTEERILRGHGADVRTVDWHPTKGLVATGSRDSQQPVKLWDPKTGQCLATLYVLIGKCLLLNNLWVFFTLFPTALGWFNKSDRKVSTFALKQLEGIMCRLQLQCFVVIGFSHIFILKID